MKQWREVYQGLIGAARLINKDPHRGLDSLHELRLLSREDDAAIAQYLLHEKDVNRRSAGVLLANRYDNSSCSHWS